MGGHTDTQTHTQSHTQSHTCTHTQPYTQSHTQKHTCNIFDGEIAYVLEVICLDKLALQKCLFFDS